MFTTSGTYRYPWSFVTDILYRSTGHDDRKSFEGSLASLLAATLYQANPDRNHKLWNIGSTAGMLIHVIESSQWEHLNYLSFVD